MPGRQRIWEGERFGGVALGVSGCQWRAHFRPKARTMKLSAFTRTRDFYQIVYIGIEKAGAGLNIEPSDHER